MGCYLGSAPTLPRMRTVISLFCCLLCSACVDPVVPSYDYTAGFVLLEGGIVDAAGGSRVLVQRSGLVFGSYQLEPVTGAVVHSVDEQGTETEWMAGPTPGEYLPPKDFSATTGHSYSIRVALADGTLIESLPEQLPVPVPLGELRLRFDQEAYYSDSRERFVPAFTLLAEVQDPAGEDNYFSYEYRTWTQLTICQTCYNSVYRNGECVQTPSSRRIDHYDYTCDGPCWGITPGRAVQLLTDERNPGATLPGVEVARIDYVGAGGILAEVQQRSLTRSAYNYYRTFEDLVEGSSGLNAPLPAPLYGNLTDVNDPANAVLGYFSVSSLSTQRLYWNRDDTDGEPLSLPATPVLEPVSPAPPSAPCDGPGRTRNQPEGWNP